MLVDNVPEMVTKNANYLNSDWGTLFHNIFHCLLIGPWEIWMKFYICNFQTDFSDWRLMHLLWNCPHMNVTGLHWWSVNIGPGNGLVPPGNKPLPGPMVTQICRHMASLGHNKLKRCWYQHGIIWRKKMTPSLNDTCLPCRCGCETSLIQTLSSVSWWLFINSTHQLMPNHLTWNFRRKNMLQIRDLFRLVMAWC